jgi:hypothetical protein
MKVIVVSTWVPRMYRNGVLNSQILILISVCMARPRHWLSIFENRRFSGGLGSDDGGNDVDLGAQNVPK